MRKYFKIGTPVSGHYFDQNYSGTVVEYRPTPDYNNDIFTIQLDSPITVYGWERDRIEIYSYSDNNSIQ
jgi:hypothetical protein